MSYNMNWRESDLEGELIINYSCSVYCEAMQSGRYSKYDLAPDHVLTLGHTSAGSHTY